MRTPYDGSDMEDHCKLWKLMGSQFAFVQSGIYDYAINGTTLAWSKKGSGINDILNPCIEKFMQSMEYQTGFGQREWEEYKNLGFNGQYAPNYMKKRPETSCQNSGGYCDCGVQAYDTFLGTNVDNLDTWLA